MSQLVTTKDQRILGCYLLKVPFYNTFNVKSGGKIMTCLRCDGKGKYRNEFGLMEKCESCQSADMTFEKIVDQDSDE